MLREVLEPPGEQAAVRFALAVRDLVDGDLVGPRVDLVEPILDVVGHVRESVVRVQHVVHLAEDVAERPLGDRVASERRAPGQRVGQQSRVLVQPAIAVGEHLRQRLLVLARQARAVAQHALDDLAPLLGRAVHPDERVALLVAERALQLEVQPGLGVTEIECSEPGARGLRLGELHRVGLGDHRRGNVLLLERRLDHLVLVAGLAQQVFHRLVAWSERHQPRGIGEARDLRRNDLRHAGRGVAVIGRVQERAADPPLPHHDRRERIARRIRYRERGRAGGRARYQDQQYSHAGPRDRTRHPHC